LPTQQPRRWSPETCGGAWDCEPMPSAGAWHHARWRATPGEWRMTTPPGRKTGGCRAGQRTRRRLIQLSLTSQGQVQGVALERGHVEELDPDS
jgi:hypothetical protein